MKTKTIFFLILTSCITSSVFSQTKNAEKVNWIECIGTGMTEFGPYCLATENNNARAYITNNCTEKVKVFYEFTGPRYDNNISWYKTKNIVINGNSKKRVEFCNVTENNGAIRVTKVEPIDKNSSSSSSKENQVNEKEEKETGTSTYRKSTCDYLAEAEESLKNAQYQGQADLARKEIARLTPLCDREKGRATYSSDKILRGTSNTSYTQQRSNRNQQNINRVIAENQRRIERQNRDADQLLNTWQNKIQTDYNLYNQEYDSYENFKSRTSNLSSLNATSYQGLISEFNGKMSQLDKEYTNREREVNQEISNRFNALKTGEYDALNDLAAALHQNQARKKLEKEKQQAKLRLKREKDEKVKIFVERFKTDVDKDRSLALEKAKYAINENDEIYFTKLYSYFDCLYRDPYGALYNNSFCKEPSGKPASLKSNYTGEDLFNAYKRKKNSYIKEIRNEANPFLEMAIRRNPDKPVWLYEKSKISNNTSEILSLLSKAVKLEPNNKQYFTELQKVQKKRYGELGEIGDKLNGKKHGKWVEYWSDGEVKQIVNYANGKIIGDYLIFYDKNWKPTKDRNKYQYYRIKTYDKNGKLSLAVKDFYKSGQLQMLGQYEDEAQTIETGEFERYYESGNLKSIRLYENGKQQGIATVYTEGGIVKRKMEYENGKLLNYLEIRDDQGKPLKSEAFQNGIARLKLNSNDKMGYVNEDGFVVVPLVYDLIGTFTNEIAIVKKNNKYGGVNKEGKEVIPLKYDELKRLQNGEILAKKEGRTGIVDNNGKESLELIFDTNSGKISFDNQGYALVKKEGKYGFIDKEGNTLIDFKYDNAYPFFDKEITWVTVEEKLKYGTKTKYGYINRDGINITPLIYDYVYPFKNDFGWVQKNGLMTFVNVQGKEIIEPKYTPLLFKDSRKDKVGYSGYEFNEGLARVKKNNKYGYVDTSGNIVIDIMYDEASHFENGEATVDHLALGLIKSKINNPIQPAKKENSKVKTVEVSEESETDIILRAFQGKDASILQNFMREQVKFKRNKKRENYFSDEVIKEMQLFFNNHPYHIYSSGVLNTKRGKTVKVSNWVHEQNIFNIKVVLEFENNQLKITEIEIE